MVTTTHAQLGPLSTGEVYKLKVEESGIYKIDEALLSSLGVDISSIDQNNIAVFGFGLGMLPQENSISRPETLIEVPLKYVGSDNNNLNSSDYFLFFAEGADKITYNSSRDFFDYELNLYDVSNYYYLRINGGERTKNINQETSRPANKVTINNLIQVYHHELEQVTALTEPSGRFWFGENFTNNTSMEVNITVNSSSSFKLKAGVMAKSRELSNFTLSIPNHVIGELSVPGARDFNNYRYGRQGYMEFEYFDKLDYESNSIPINITFSKPQSDSEGFLDYLTLNTFTSLSQDKTNLVYYQKIEPQSDGVTVPTSQDFDYVWDITNTHDVKDALISSSEITINKTENYFSIICFDIEDVNTPEIIGEIENQDLRNINVPDLLIITSSEYLNQAQRLANHRESFNNIDVEVVDINHVYNEFSSGRQDITAIRDFARSLYLENTEKFKYLLLFGQGSYDYKGIRYQGQSQIPIYESRDVLHRVRSFSSDDYFGFFDEDEGFWGENIDGRVDNDDLEIGIGRLPARNVDNATILVDKLIAYDTNSVNNSGWKKNVLFVADDGDGNTHQRDANSLALYVEETYPDFNSQRVYIDNQPKVSTPSGAKSPQINEELVNWVDNEGVLIVNYSGHGSITNWAEEGILNADMVENFTNNDQLSLFFTATCEFGRYDNPNILSSAERLLFNESGGSMSLLTTTRPVYASSNFKINKAFYESIFLKDDNDNYITLGESFRLTKNNSLSGVNNRNFALLGDPSLHLNIPQREVAITAINDIDISNIDTLKALDHVHLNGQIEINNQLDNTFNGEVYLTLYEKQTESETRGNDGPETVFNYLERKYQLYRGVSSVVNGEFEMNFTIPKDIRYAYDDAKFSFYAKSEINEDGIGSNKNIILGGTSDSPMIDNTPPEIELDIYSEKENIVYPDTYVTATISDESGINLSGIGAGHDVLLMLNSGDSTWIVNDYLSPIIDDNSSYTFTFPLNDLPEGENTLTLEAWDISNNRSSTTISFFVSEVSDIEITNYIAFPNPIINDFDIRFTHNLLGQNLDIKSNIIAMNGNIVATNDFEVINSESEILISYEGLRSNYQMISGVYIVQLIINCPALGIKTYQTSRIVLK